MSLNLSAELREFVDGEIRAGRYPNEEAAVADALLRMKEHRENDLWLRAEIEKGVASLDAGKGREWNVDAVKERLAERLRAKGRST